MNPEAIYYLLDEWYMGKNAGRISLDTMHGATKTLINKNMNESNRLKS